MIKNEYNINYFFHYQISSDPFYREPLHCASAEENGSAPHGSATGQAGPVKYKCERVQTSAISRAFKRESACQGEVIYCTCWKLEVEFLCD